MRVISAAKLSRLLAVLATGLFLLPFPTRCLLAGTVSSTSVTVSVDRAILRMGPSFQAEVVGQVDSGIVLSATGLKDEWVSVVPPTNVLFWVHSDYVTNGLVHGSLVRVRLGPSVNHLVIAELKRGSPVTIRERKSDWYSIDPPSGILLWISRSLVTGHVPDETENAERRHDPWRDRRSRGI